MAALTSRSPVPAVLRLPGDKSISHRALILAALATGESIVRGILHSDDVESTARVLRQLGADIPALTPELRIRGRGVDGLHAPTAPLDCGNSGTTARLVGGVIAGCNFTATLTGDASLRQRPMDRIARPLSAMGARIELAAGGTMPMTITGGTLSSIDWTPDVASAQVKSAILLAGLVAGVLVAVREAVPTRDHTERMLAAMGARISGEDGVVRLAPSALLTPLDLTVPGDPSSLAFLAAAAALSATGQLRAQLLANDGRTGFYDALARMGAMLRFGALHGAGGERVRELVVTGGGPLTAVDIASEDVPAMIDELPIFACVAACGQGTSTVSGAAELRTKESDRIHSIVSNLRALGIDAAEQPDGFVVRGTGGVRPLAGEVRSHGDHRIAMAFGVLSAVSGGRIAIDDRACVASSYPDFWNDLSVVTTRPIDA